MKFAPDVLLEIVNIVQKGLAKGVDVSEYLRKIEVRVVEVGGRLDESVIKLTERYVASRENEEITDLWE